MISLFLRRFLQAFQHPVQVGIVLLVRQGGVFHEAVARQFGAATAVLFSFLAAALVDGADIVVCIPEPEYLAANLPASAACSREVAAFCTYGSAGRGFDKFIFPQPPFAFVGVGIFGIDKVFYGAVQIELAAVYQATAQSAFFGIKLFSPLAAQGGDGGVAHGNQVLLGLRTYVGDLAEFGHNKG